MLRVSVCLRIFSWPVRVLLYFVQDDVYWPVKVASSIQFGPISIRNVGYNVDDNNMNIHCKELRMSLESSDYVSES